MAIYRQLVLTMSAMSSTKLRTPLHALPEERHFALVDGFALPTVGSLRNRFRSGTQSDPCISSIRNCDHDYYFELLLFSEEEMPNQLLDVRRNTIAISG